jgi:hypothetical protein
MVLFSNDHKILTETIKSKIWLSCVTDLQKIMSEAGGTFQILGNKFNRSKFYSGRN